jgi:hypothetical protein
MKKKRRKEKDAGEIFGLGFVHRNVVCAEIIM